MHAVKIPRLEAGSIGPRKETCVNWDGPIAMVPCLHQAHFFTKRKLRVWRDQKCIPLVGAKTILTCAGRQNTLSRLMRYRAKNGKLSKLGRTIAMVSCLYQGNIYTKRKLRVWRDQKPYLPVRAVKLPSLVGGSIGPRTESFVNWDGPIAIVLCLHQGNIYTKRKLRVLRGQKCIPLVRAKIILTCAVSKEAA